VSIFHAESELCHARLAAAARGESVKTGSGSKRRIVGCVPRMDQFENRQSQFNTLGVGFPLVRNSTVATGAGKAVN
jgi:hypothetical protein